MRVEVERLAGPRLKITARDVTLIVDRTREEGGPGDGFRSGELLLAALGSCMAGTLLSYADGRGLAVTAVRVGLEDDVADAPKRIRAIRATIEIGGDLTDDDLTRLRRVASRCKISNTLAQPPDVTLDVVRAPAPAGRAAGSRLPLVTPDWLAARLDDPGIRIVEVSIDPPAKAAYFQSHIPGSTYRNWKDLCWDELERRFPDAGEMSRRLGELGVDDDTTLVLVGDPLQFATYPYWVLWMAGLGDRAVVLDGGRRSWLERGLPTTDAVGTIAPVPGPRPAAAPAPARVGRDDVLARLNDRAAVLLDLRSDEEFRGDRVAPLTAPMDHGAERAGHIPGARHLYFERLLNDDGTFRPADEIADELAAVGADDSTDIVTYCRLSHRASLGWFALTQLAGFPNVRVYDGSWTEWGSMVGMPIARPAAGSDLSR